MFLFANYGGNLQIIWNRVNLWPQNNRNCYSIVSLALNPCLNAIDKLYVHHERSSVITNDHGWGVKLYSLTHSLTHSLTQPCRSRQRTSLTLCERMQHVAILSRHATTRNFPVSSDLIPLPVTFFRGGQRRHQRVEPTQSGDHNLSRMRNPKTNRTVSLYESLWCFGNVKRLVKRDFASTLQKTSR